MNSKASSLRDGDSSTQSSIGSLTSYNRRFFTTVISNSKSILTDCRFSQKWPQSFSSIKVGPPVAGRPPRRSRRAVFPNRAPLNPAGRDAAELARGGSTVGEVPRFGSLVGLFYDMRVRNGEGFPHLREAGPEALRVADDSVIVEVTGKSAPERRRQFPERTAAVVARPIELKPEKGEALASLYIASAEAKNAAFLHCHTSA